MNSKDCLKHICDECQRNAGKIQVACPFRSISNEYCDEYVQIKQDLDRLEQLEKERQEVETSLSSKETNTFDEIATMIKKANDYDVLVNKCKQLEKEKVFRHLQSVQEFEKEIKELRKAVKSWNENGGKLIRENTKLKKALDILKQKGNLAVDRQKILDEDDNYLVCYFFGGGTKKYTLLREINKEEYELLKNVLEE